MSIYDYRNANFSIGTQADGAPLLVGFLSVNTTDNTVTGVAHFSQPVSPSLEFTTKLEGVEHATGFGGTAQVFGLKGVAPGIPGAKYLISLGISLPQVWGSEGVATYTYYTDTPNNVTIANAPAKINWLLLAE